MAGPAGLEFLVNVYSAVLFIAPLAMGALAGYVAGGSLAGLLSIKLRALWLLWLAAAVQAAELYVRVLSRDVRLPLLVVTVALAGAWLAAHLPGRPRALKSAACAALARGLVNGAASGRAGRMSDVPASARGGAIVPGRAPRRNVAAARWSRLVALGDI